MICAMGSEIMGHDRFPYENYVVIRIYGYKIDGLQVQGVMGSRDWKAIGSMGYGIQYISYNSLIGLGLKIF